MESPTNTWHRIWTLRLLVTCVALGIIAALGQLIPTVLNVWQQISWGYLGWAAGLTVAYRVLNALGWGLVLRAFGQQLPPTIVLRTWLRSEACRWLPGSVWCLGSRAFLAGQLGLAPAVAAASVAWEFILTILAWVATCLLGLAVGGVAPLAIASRLPISMLAMMAGVIAAGIGATCLWLRSAPAGKKQLVKLQQKLTDIQSLRPHAGWSATILVYYIAMCLLNGFALQYIIRSFAPDVQLPLLTAAGINAVAWLVGFLAVIAPSGVVVREGCLAGLLIAWLPDTTALAVAVTWRLLQISVELTCLFATYLPALGKKILRSQSIPSVGN